MAVALRRFLKPCSAARFLLTSRVICNSLTPGIHSVETDSVKNSEIPPSYEEQGDTKEEYRFTDDGIQLYEGHRPITGLQRSLLTIGAAVTSLYDPTRGDMVAALGQTTGHQALRRMHQKMANDSVGQEILRDQPRVNSKTVDMDKLRQLPDGSFGREYIRFMDDCRITSDSRAQVQYVDDKQLAYVMQRYIEIHDFVHVLCGLSISVPHEIAVKWFEMLQTGLPMCAISSFFGPLGLTPSERQVLRKQYIPWALHCGRHAHFILNVYYEKHFDEPLHSLRQTLNITQAPLRG